MIESCIVMHCGADQATGALTALLIKQDVAFVIKIEISHARILQRLEYQLV